MIKQIYLHFPWNNFTKRTHLNFFKINYRVAVVYVAHVSWKHYARSGVFGSVEAIIKSDT